MKPVSFKPQWIWTSDHMSQTNPLITNHKSNNHFVYLLSVATSETSTLKKSDNVQQWFFSKIVLFLFFFYYKNIKSSEWGLDAEEYNNDESFTKSRTKLVKTKESYPGS